MHSWKSCFVHVPKGVAMKQVLVERREILLRGMNYLQNCCFLKTSTCSRMLLFLLLFAFILFSGEIRKSFGEENRFLDHADGTVTDRLTGLMWAKNAGPAAGAYNWFSALDAISRLNANKYCGYHDWRLPNINELATLIDRSRYAPALPCNHPFSNVKVWYWTSTTTADYSNHAWRIYFFLGHIDYGHKQHMFNHVWPVRTASSAVDLIPKTGQNISYYAGDDGALKSGKAWPEKRFYDHGDGTVTDHLSGLMWTKNANLLHDKRNWSEAKKFIMRLNVKKHCGYKDWRLPKVEDFRTLLNYSKENPALPVRNPFLHIASDIYWSSEPNVQESDYIWCVNLKNSRVDYYNKINHAEYIWGVRNVDEITSTNRSIDLD